MDAGVPLTRPVAGIAMGLIKEDRGFAVLSDILGDEDHLGDMDFKVAGTEQGITCAADGHQDHLDHAGDHAHRAGAGARRAAAHPGRDGQGDHRRARRRRRHRAAHHHHQRAEGEDPRGDRHRRQGDPRDRRADQCKIDIDDDGTIKIAATDITQAQQAIDWIRGIVAEPEIGVIYNGKVVKTADFGAFVNFLGSRDGLVHISELQQGRVGKTTDVVNVGDAVKVKVIGFDERGKVKLSMRVVDQATGEDITEKVGAEAGRGDRGSGRSRPRRARPAARERPGRASRAPEQAADRSAASRIRPRLGRVRHRRVRRCGAQGWRASGPTGTDVQGGGRRSAVRAGCERGGRP